MNEQHLSAEQFYQLIDGTQSVEATSRMQKHLGECRLCAGNYNAVLGFERKVRQLPLDLAGADLGQKVLSKLGIVPKSPFLFRLVEKAAYVFGLLIVIGVMATVFILTGVVEMDQVAAGVSPAQKILSDGGGAIADGIGRFTMVLKEYLPFAFGSGTMTISVFVAVVVSMLAVADKLVGRKIVHRLR